MQEQHCHLTLTEHPTLVLQQPTGEGVEKMSKKVSHAYVQGLIWVLTYYVHGNSPIPITNAHTDAMTAAQDRLQGKGNSAADSSEGLGAAWDW